MKNKKTIFAWLLSSTLLFSNRATAQLPDTKEPHHKVVLKNQYITILEGRVPAHDTTPAHTHTANSVVVFLSRSTFGIKVPGQEAVLTEVNPGDMKYAAYGDKPVNHIVWNQTMPLFHFLVVELAKQPPGMLPGKDTCPVLSQPGVKFQWRRKLVSAYYADIAEGTHYQLPKSNCAYLLIDVSGRVTTVSSGSTHSLEVNGFVFYPPQNEIGIGSGNKKSARCILLQLK